MSRGQSSKSRMSQRRRLQRLPLEKDGHPSISWKEERRQDHQPSVSSIAAMDPWHAFSPSEMQLRSSNGRHYCHYNMYYYETQCSL